MTLMVLFGAMFLAFSIPVAVFAFVVRQSPKLVIVMTTRYLTLRLVVAGAAFTCTEGLTGIPIARTRGARHGAAPLYGCWRR